MSQDLILASASKSRQDMLLKAGIPHRPVAAEINESALKAKMTDQGLRPEKISEQLALMKAYIISKQYPGHVILGADQILDCEGRLFDKPENLEEAREHLQFFRNKQHYLYTSYALVQNGEALYKKTKSPCLTMRDFSDDFLDEYLEKSGDKILKSVGCYLLEDRGAQLFSKIEGDYFTILGLPLLNVMENLRELNILKS